MKKPWTFTQTEAGYEIRDAANEVVFAERWDLQPSEFGTGTLEPVGRVEMLREMVDCVNAAP